MWDRDLTFRGKGQILENNIKVICSAKPGITGLWQVSGRSNTGYKYRVKLDAWYVMNWSLWLDIVILFKTIRVVFKVGRGILNNAYDIINNL